jgi:retron-type reverse transcriptase
MAEISPIFKKKDQLCKENYRPVSILPTFSKILEQQMAQQMQQHFEGIFYQYVSAYRKKYSCQNVLLNLIDQWRNALDNACYVGALFMDLSKCFDCMPHALLISKLDAYGVSTEACRLLSDYLCNRKQRTKIGVSRSTWVEITKGVPQGSGLGPFLFNVFINDLFLFMVVCKLHNYADDNTITKMDRDVNVVLNSLKTDACNAITWFQSNFMKANPDKFQVMFLCPRSILIYFRMFSVFQILKYRENINLNC